jgi:hypothetical protein
LVVSAQRLGCSKDIGYADVLSAQIAYSKPKFLAMASGISLGFQELHLLLVSFSWEHGQELHGPGLQRRGISDLLKGCTGRF